MIDLAIAAICFAIALLVGGAGLFVWVLLVAYVADLVRGRV